jgi:hypothetical protein
MAIAFIVSQRLLVMQTFYLSQIRSVQTGFSPFLSQFMVLSVFIFLSKNVLTLLYIKT